MKLVYFGITKLKYFVSSVTFLTKKTFFPLFLDIFEMNNGDVYG